MSNLGISHLIAADHANPKRIAVVGDPMIDAWVLGKMSPSADGPKFVGDSVVTLPGGAANAARQLEHWQSSVTLYGPVGPTLDVMLDRDGAVDATNWRMANPLKTRWLADGKIVFRQDDEEERYGLTAKDMDDVRLAIMTELLGDESIDAVLVSDYHKGFVTDAMVSLLIERCGRRKIPLVCDVKRPGAVHQHAILKLNLDAAHNPVCWPSREHKAEAVVTRGGEAPHLYRAGRRLPVSNALPAVRVVNHVGAGDCFSAHLTLALAHGLSFEDAVTIAHSAGRVFVQHPLARPPWPHEIRKDLHPIAGKVLTEQDAGALRASLSGRVVFTNGVFRAPHAGHAWLMQWAKTQGHVLVVGVNDDGSARRLRDGYVTPLAERCELLASQAAVDWVIPFADASPCALLRALKPDLLVKGNEYADSVVPGAELVPMVAFAPESPYHRHSTDLIAAMVRAG